MPVNLKPLGANVYSAFLVKREIKEGEELLMLKADVSRAGEAFSKGFGIALLRFQELFGYLADIEKGAPALKQIMRRETESIWRGMKGGDFDRYINRAVFESLPVEKLEAMIEASFAAKYATHLRIAHASALALAHAMVDEILMQACWMSAYADPSAWLKDVEAQKLSIKELAGQSVDDLLQNAVLAKVSSYERMSVACKTTRLLKICGKQIGEVSPDFQLDHGRMEAIDRRRHDMLHSLSPDEPLPGGLGDLEFMQRSAIKIILAVASRYGLKANVEDAWKHGFGQAAPFDVDVGTFVGTNA